MSAAPLAPDLQGTGLDTGPAPVWIVEDRETFKKRVHLVHPDYLRRAHTAADLSAIVTQDGEPITQAGETLTIGLVPPWRRYAIGPVVGGRAELLRQDEFERENAKVYIDSFRFRRERPDDEKLRAVPNVREFVSWKIDLQNPGRICPLGTHMEKQEPIRGAQAYDPARDEFSTAQTAAVRADLEEQLAEERRKREELEAKVNALAGVTAAPKRRGRPPKKREEASDGAVQA